MIYFQYNSMFSTDIFITKYIATPSMQLTRLLTPSQAQLSIKKSFVQMNSFAPNKFCSIVVFK